MASRNLVGIVHNPGVPGAALFAASIVKSLGIEQSTWVASAAELDVYADMMTETATIVTVGGDGTILRVVRFAAPHSVPIVGVNMGRVGFMTELSVDEAEEKLPQYLNGGVRIEERMMLQASVRSVSEVDPHLVVHALNDVVLTRGSIARLLDIETKIDGVVLTTYRADGVIVATPTGSTGYALSAGGPILYPEAQQILLQPLAAHMSFQTGIVIAVDSFIELSARGDHEAVLNVDGFSDTVISSGDIVSVEKSPQNARFLRGDSPSAFYSTLTMGLGVSGRQVPPSPSM